MRAVPHDVKLHDPRLLDPVREFPGAATVVMQTLWPNLIVQQQSNTLAMRQLVPARPEHRSTCTGPSSATPTTTPRCARAACGRRT